MRIVVLELSFEALALNVCVWFLTQTHTLFAGVRVKKKTYILYWA